MKTLKNTLRILIISLALLSSNLNICLADNNKPTENLEQSCSTSISVNIEVIISDCPAGDNCQFEILVFDLSDCSVDTQPIAKQDYLYGVNPSFSLSINNTYVKVCVRKKPGTSCIGYTYYAPKCECQIATAGNMTFTNVDFCKP